MIPPDMTPKMMERAQRNRQLVHELMPEFVAKLEELARQGLFRGWRDVTFVGTIEEADTRHAEEEPRRLTYRQFVFLGNEGNQKWTISAG